MHTYKLTVETAQPLIAVRYALTNPVAVRFCSLFGESPKCNTNQDGNEGRGVGAGAVSTPASQLM
jgi:hypothetical protein